MNDDRPYLPDPIIRRLRYAKGRAANGELLGIAQAVIQQLVADAERLTAERDEARAEAEWLRGQHADPDARRRYAVLPWEVES